MKQFTVRVLMASCALVLLACLFGCRPPEPGTEPDAEVPPAVMGQPPIAVDEMPGEAQRARDTAIPD